MAQEIYRRFAPQSFANRRAVKECPSCRHIAREQSGFGIDGRRFVCKRCQMSFV